MKIPFKKVIDAFEESLAGWTGLTVIYETVKNHAEYKEWRYKVMSPTGVVLGTTTLTWSLSKWIVDDAWRFFESRTGMFLEPHTVNRIVLPLKEFMEHKAETLTEAEGETDGDT
jgi:hypothetical protein